MKRKDAFIVLFWFCALFVVPLYVHCFVPCSASYQAATWDYNCSQHPVTFSHFIHHLFN